MKIAVYTIALNEEKHVKRWYESVKDADYILIADTGSTDKTVKIAKKLGINVIQISIKPWRFDDSRNAALAALPDDIDYCVSLDMDETLSEGWRERLEKMTGDQIEYKLILSFKDEDEKHPDEYFINNRIHKRHGFRWNYFIHEAIVPDRIHVKHEFCEGLYVEHHPDKEKSREQYNKMIEDAFHEYKNERYYMYYILELLKFDKKEDAIKILKSFVKSSKASKLNKALAYTILGSTEDKWKILNLLKSLLIEQTRENYNELAIYYYKKEKWVRAYWFAKKADSIKLRTQSILRNDYAWGCFPINIMLASKYNMRLFKWLPSYKKKKREINLGSQITHKFKLFND